MSNFLESPSSSPAYDVAIVGAGPAGIATACIIGALNKNLKVVVFDKRPQTTRDHSLSIQSDSIHAINKFLNDHSQLFGQNANHEAIKLLSDQFRTWSYRNVATSTIENTLAEIAKTQLKIPVYRKKDYYVTHSNKNKEDPCISFDKFLNQTGGAKIIIGADGSKSEIRKVIGAQKVDEKNLGYLVELKYQAPENFKPRTYLEGSNEAVTTSGFDFETAGHSKDGKPGMVTLQKFVDFKTHQSILKGTKGSPENPWTMDELNSHLQDKQVESSIFQHLKNYLDGRKIEELGFNKIITFPMTIYRSSHVAAYYKDRIVMLVGDASSGLVLRRGVNKALIEASLCSKAVLDFFSEKKQGVTATATFKVGSFICQALPKEFIQYQKNSQNLFASEVRWARANHIALNSCELALKFIVMPFKLILKLISIVNAIHALWVKYAASGIPFNKPLAKIATT